MPPVMIIVTDQQQFLHGLLSVTCGPHAKNGAVGILSVPVVRMLVVFRDDHDDLGTPSVPTFFTDDAAAQQKCRSQRYQDHKFLIHS